MLRGCSACPGVQKEAVLSSGAEPAADGGSAPQRSQSRARDEARTHTHTHTQSQQHPSPPPDTAYRAQQTSSDTTTALRAAPGTKPHWFHPFHPGMPGVLRQQTMYGMGATCDLRRDKPDDRHQTCLQILFNARFPACDD